MICAGKEGARINGDTIFSESNFTVSNPYFGNVISEVSASSVIDIRHAISSSFNYKSKLSKFDRYEILTKAANLLHQKASEAANLITSESGLSLKDSCHEVSRVINVLKLGANESLKDFGQSFSYDTTDINPGRRGLTIQEPISGVIAAITPFNHPMNQVAHKVVPSIATNNRIIIKPSEKTPLSALFFADLMYKSGLPVEMLQVVVGDPELIANEFLRNKFIGLISFTGSVDIGKRIAKKAGYRKVILELGGNDPLIVMDDADIEKAVDLAASGSYGNSGQRCTAVKRILVQKKIASDFTSLLVEKTKEWSYGNPFDRSVKMGSLINKKSAENIKNIVSNAIKDGARLLCGNEINGAIYSPTVLNNVNPKMGVVVNETFGPVSPVIAFDTVSDAIRISNSTRYGLSAGVCTNNIDLINEFISGLDVGSVNIWEAPSFRSELTPFGGIKDSGLGQKEGIQEAMRFFTNTKLFTMPA